MTFKHLLIFTVTIVTVFVNQIQAQSPTSAARRFNVFVLGDATLTTNEAEGPIAVGGNVTTAAYGIKFDPAYGAYYVKSASIGLAVRGGVKLAGGSLKIDRDNYIKIGNCLPNSSDATNLKVWLKDEKNNVNVIKITATNDSYPNTQNNITINSRSTTWTPNVSETVNPVCEQVFGTGDGQIDIDAAFVSMTKRSEQLATLTNNLPITNENGSETNGPILTTNGLSNNLKIKITSSMLNRLNVLTVSAAVWNSINGSVVFEGMPTGPALAQTSSAFGVVINIINVPDFQSKNGNTIKFPNFGGLADAQGSYILYNFPDAKNSVRVAGNVLFGTMFAPQADLIKANNGNINGQIIAKSLVHNGDEIHYAPFITSIPEPVEKAITVVATSKCANDAPYLDYTITPSYTTSETATIEFINSEGKVVQTKTSQALTGSILFPGATVDNTGKGNAWPGWASQGGKWVEVADLNGSIRKAGAKIRVTLTPTKTIDISYPATTTGCRTSPPADTPLPVSLASFTAKNENCAVQLKWKVTEAKNFSHFVVQRSTDAKSFASLNEIKYLDTNKDYSYNDSPFSNEVAPAKYYYYRLKQVDTDASFEYSTIRAVESGQCDARLSVEFYPNPTQDEVNIKSFSPVKMVEILTIGGKRVYQALPAQNQTELKVNVQAFSQGLYIVNIVNADGKHSSKLLKK